MKPLRCYLGRHQRIRVIDRADWRGADFYGVAYQVKEQHFECARCKKLLP